MLALQGAAWHVADLPDRLPGPCNGVVVDLRAEIPAQWQQFLTSCALAGIPVYHYKHIREAITGRLEIEHLSENMLGSHNPHDGYRKFKRIVDFVTAAVAIVVLAPLLLAVAALVRLETDGPAYSSGQTKPRRQDFHDLQVPQHGGWQRDSRLATGCDHPRWRSTHHQGGRVSAQDADR